MAHRRSVVLSGLVSTGLVVMIAAAAAQQPPAGQTPPAGGRGRGLASLMIANDPRLTNKQVMAIIKSTARDVGTPGVDQYTGYGIIDAAAALKAPSDYFLLAGLNRVEVVQKGKVQAVRLRGTADANALTSDWIAVGDDLRHAIHTYERQSRA